MSFVHDGNERRVKEMDGTVATTNVHAVLGWLVAEYGGAVGARGLQYLTSDHLGSTRLVPDAAGAVVKRYDNLPFGQELSMGISGRTSESKYQELDLADPQRVKLAGKERDSETVGRWRPA